MTKKSGRVGRNTRSYNMFPPGLGKIKNPIAQESTEHAKATVIVKNKNWHP